MLPHARHEDNTVEEGQTFQQAVKIGTPQTNENELHTLIRCRGNMVDLNVSYMDMRHPGKWESNVAL